MPTATQSQQEIITGAQGSATRRTTRSTRRQQQDDASSNGDGTTNGNDAAQGSATSSNVASNQQNAPSVTTTSNNTNAAASSSTVTTPGGVTNASAQQGTSSTGNTNNSSYRVSQIEYVQQLIEECLKLYMDKFTCIQQIYITHPDIEPGFINLMWGRLEQQNPDFFRAYNHRLYLKRQIHLFNSLVGFQARLMQQQGCKFISSASSTTAASSVQGMQPSPFAALANPNATPTSAGGASTAGLSLAQTNPLNPHAISPSSSNSSFSNAVKQFADQQRAANNAPAQPGTPNMMPQQAAGAMMRGPPSAGNSSNFPSPNFMNPLAFSQANMNAAALNQAKLFNLQQQQGMNTPNVVQGGMFPVQGGVAGTQPLAVQNQQIFNALQQHMAQNSQSGFPTSMSPSLITNAIINMRMNQQKLNQQQQDNTSNNATPTGASDVSSPVTTATSTGPQNIKSNVSDTGSNHSEKRSTAKNLGLNINTSGQQQNDATRSGFPTPTSAGTIPGSQFPTNANPHVSNFYNPAAANVFSMNPQAFQMPGAGQNGFVTNSALIQQYSNMAAANQQQQQNATPSSAGSFSFQNAMQNPAMRPNAAFDPSQFRNMLDQQQKNSQFSLMGEDSNSSVRNSSTSFNAGLDMKKKDNMFNPNMNAFNRTLGLHPQAMTNNAQYVQQFLQNQRLAQQMPPNNTFPFQGMPNGIPMGGGIPSPMADPMQFQQQNGSNTKQSSSSSSRKRKSSPAEKSSRPSKRRKDSADQERNERMRLLMEQYKSPEQQQVFKNALKESPNIDIDQLERRLIMTGQQQQQHGNMSPGNHFSTSTSKSRSNSEFQVPKSTTQSSSGLNFHPLEDDDHGTDYDPNNLWGDRPAHSEPTDLFDVSGDMLAFNTEEEDPCDAGLFNEYFN